MLPAGTTLEQVVETLIKSVYEEGEGEKVISVDTAALTREGDGWRVPFVGSTEDGEQAQQTFVWDGKSFYYEAMPG